MTDTMQVCPVCDSEFTPKSWGNTRTCSPECGQVDYRRRGEGVAVLPAESKGMRKTPMTDAEFVAELARNRRALLDRGEPLVNPNMLGAQEKRQRELDHERRMAAETRQNRLSGAEGGYVVSTVKREDSEAVTRTGAAG